MIFSAAEIPESLIPTRIGLLLKILYTGFVLFLIPIYWKKWGPVNFLWFSDIALILSVPALWLESSLLASMMAVGVLLPEIYWNLELFFRLLTGRAGAGLTDYMFDSSHPLYLRLLSLFHVILPFVVLLMLYEFGYDTRAIYYQTVFAWVILYVTFKLSSPADNINWVYGLGKSPQTRISPHLYLLLLMLLFLIGLFMPTHFLLNWFF